MEYKKNKNKELLLKCDCGCNSQILIQNVSNNDLQIDCRDDGRSKWHGVWLDKEKSKRVKEFLNNL